MERRDKSDRAIPVRLPSESPVEPDGRLKTPDEATACRESRETAEISPVSSLPRDCDPSEPEEISSPSRGPQMARIGILAVTLLASTGLVFNALGNAPHRTLNLVFYGGELSLGLAMLIASYSDWFSRRWDAITLANELIIIAAITAISARTGVFTAALLGLILLQVGSAAFLPWHPWHQFWLNFASLACLGVFTFFTSASDPALSLQWTVLIAGALIGQVACISSFRYRRERDLRLRVAQDASRRLASEVREREKVISQLRETQQELVASREAALMASRAKSDFLSSMSHEIRTPLNVVLGMAEVLEETDLDSEQRQYLDRIQSGGKILLELINSILDLARIESGRMAIAAEEFDLREAIENVADTLAIAAHAKGIELIVHLRPRLPTRVVGDSMRLGQVLINVIGNAIKFTDHGQVVVRVEPEPSEIPATVRFTVADTGIGIPPDKLNSIFEPFTQADSSTARAYGGSGLGLALVSRMVTLMAGKISVASEVGKGSTFIFTVRFQKIIEDERHWSADLAGVAVLIVDDHEAARVALREMLMSLGATVEEFRNALETRTPIGQSRARTSPYIVLLDGSNTDLTLTKALDALVAAGINPPEVSVMLRTTDLTEELTKLRSRGVASYLTKPVKRQNLLKAIHTILQAATSS